MPPRRVALVIGQLHLGGAERQLFELAVRLDRSNYDPVVVCLSNLVAPYAARLTRAGIPVEVLPRSAHREWGRARALARLFVRRKIDLAHSFLLAANSYVYAARTIGSLTALLQRRLPFIASSRVSSPAVGWLSMQIHRRAFAAAAAVIVNSRAVYDHTRDLYAVAPERLHLIHNGVALEEYPVASPRDDEARRALGAADPACVLIGTMGRLAPQKNMGLFLDLAARLCEAGERGAALRFAVVGEGPERRELQERAARLGLNDKVVFAGAREDVPRMLSALDLFVMTSNFEGLPNAVMEAMAASRPVVATRAGGTEELVQDGVTGYLAPPGDVEGLARGIERLAINPDARREMGRRARARIEADFSVEKMVRQTTALYDQVRA